jgi:hypothetical protein
LVKIWAFSDVSKKFCLTSLFWTCRQIEKILCVFESVLDTDRFAHIFAKSERIECLAQKKLFCKFWKQLSGNVYRSHTSMCDTFSTLFYFNLPHEILKNVTKSKEMTKNLNNSSKKPSKTINLGTWGYFGVSHIFVTPWLPKVLRGVPFCKTCCSVVCKRRDLKFCTYYLRRPKFSSR